MCAGQLGRAWSVAVAVGLPLLWILAIEFADDVLILAIRLKEAETMWN